MKSEHLLEAIGHVDETLLADQISIQTPRRRILRAALIAALIAALAFGAAAFDSFFPKQGSTIRMNNMSTGGNFTYHDGYVYQAGYGCIYRIDIETGDRSAILLPEQDFTTYLIAADEGIAYVDPYTNYRYISYDGADACILLEDVGLRHAFVDGHMIYTHDGSDLRRIDTSTGETTLLHSGGITDYFVDGTYIYALTSSQENCVLRSRKDQIFFEPLDLSFQPQRVVAHDDDLYFFSNQRPVVLYRGGVETELPFTTYWLHAMDDKLIYLDKHEKYVLKSYDLTTGDITLLQRDVFEFAVLEDRYLCMIKFTEETVIWDLETGMQTVSSCPD